MIEKSLTLGLKIARNVVVCPAVNLVIIGSMMKGSDTSHSTSVSKSLEKHSNDNDVGFLMILFLFHFLLNVHGKQLRSCRWSVLLTTLFLGRLNQYSEHIIGF